MHYRCTTDVLHICFTWTWENWRKTGRLQQKPLIILLVHISLHCDWMRSAYHVYMRRMSKELATTDHLISAIGNLLNATVHWLLTVTIWGIESSHLFGRMPLKEGLCDNKNCGICNKTQTFAEKKDRSCKTIFFEQFLWQRKLSEMNIDSGIRSVKFATLESTSLKKTYGPCKFLKSEKIQTIYLT